jgi:hypothetical protein
VSYFRTTDELASLVVTAIAACQSREHDRNHEATAPIPTGPPLATGAWRAEFAYRAVLEQPARFELLETLDLPGLREAVHALSPDGASAPDDILAPLRSKDISS